MLPVDSFRNTLGKRTVMYKILPQYVLDFDVAKSLHTINSHRIRWVTVDAAAIQEVAVTYQTLLGLAMSLSPSSPGLSVDVRALRLLTLAARAASGGL